VTLLAAPDPWIDWVGLCGRDLWLVSAAGLARGPVDGTLAPVAGGEDVASAAVAGSRVYAAGGGRLLRFEGGGRGAEEYLPARPRKLLAASSQVFADTDAGLYRETGSGWVLARPRPMALPPGSAHVSALGLLGSRLVLGAFAGGLALGQPAGQDWSWSRMPGAPAWAVNAILASGNGMYVASLRGAARFDGQRWTAMAGGAAGPAFALAATRDGIAVGYGQGLLLPGSRFLSAFHGLPGNQALALAGSDPLFVGTPSGLGAVSGNKVAWRVTAGEGRLPHPWVTALALRGDALYIGTYGGGVARRTAAAGSPKGRFEPFPETDGLKVNTGCLVEAGGRLFLGTDGQGLFRLSQDGSRFEALRLALPSPRITAILPGPDALYVGTDEGLARLRLPLADGGA
jgi:ligand-binding sensor domain-containing protein